MIIQNGYIEEIKVANGGIDPNTGYPVAGKVSYCFPIPCQYLPKSNRQAVLAEGERNEVKSYEVLIEEPLCCQFGPEKVRLTDLCGNTVGVFVVESVEPLEAVSEVRLNLKIR